MDTNPLDNLIGAYAKQALPCPRDGGTADIWRAIEARRRSSFWSRVLASLDWRELFLEPRLAAAAFAVAVVAAIVPAYLTSTQANAETQIARHSLHLDVFSSRASDLLASPRTVLKP